MCYWSSFGCLGLCCQSEVQLLELIFITLEETFMVNEQPESSKDSFLGKVSVTQRIAQRLSVITSDVGVQSSYIQSIVSPHSLFSLKEASLPKPKVIIQYDQK